MKNAKRYDKILLIIRWVARIISLFFVGLFLLFFIGEANLKEFLNLSITEILLMIFIPLLFILAAIISWERELLGGILIIASVVGFNSIDILAETGFTWELEFGFLLIPGVLFILLSYLKKRKV